MEDNLMDFGTRKMQCIVASPGQFMETLRKHAGSNLAVLPHAMDWHPVLTSENPLEAIINLPHSH